MSSSGVRIGSARLCGRANADQERYFADFGALKFLTTLRHAISRKTPEFVSRMEQ
jgi:hypothetical protein